MLIARHDGNGRRFEPLALTPGQLHLRGEAGDGRRLEDGPQGHLDLEGVASPGDDLDSEERMTAEIIEAL
ncbi:MAG: hypothetical protein ABI193_24460, partial [Minicystis sp.]